MIKLKNRAVRLLMKLGLFSVLLFGQSALAKTENLAFHESMSDVMMN